MRLFVKGMAVACFAAVCTASQAIIVIGGVDVPSEFGDPRPNSNTAAANFAALASSINSVNTITWENQTVGDQGPYNPFAGVTVSSVNTDATFHGIRDDVVQQIGYNTTLFGSKFLRVVHGANANDGRVDFFFANGISSFGLYVTGLQDDFPGDVTMEFFDGNGNFQSIEFDKPIPINGDTSTQFWGFIDEPDAFITQVSIVNRGDRSSTRDVYALDDIMFTNCNVVPEPASIAALLLGAGVLIRRRKR